MNVDQVSDVLMLLEQDAVRVGRDINIEKVAYWSFILHIQARCEIRSKLLVERAGSVVEIQSEQVIYVTAYKEWLR
eukprot:6197156-Pleurochrysis_carterae.AAC.7